MKNRFILFYSILFLLGICSCQLFEPEVGGPCHYVDFDAEFTAKLRDNDIFMCKSKTGRDIELYLSRATLYSYM